MIHKIGFNLGTVPKMEINSCSVRSKKAFSLSFIGIGRYVFFEITVNF